VARASANRAIIMARSSKSVSDMLEYLDRFVEEPEASAAHGREERN
jgi:hypothetical protein